MRSSMFHLLFLLSTTINTFVVPQIDHQIPFFRVYPHLYSIERESFIYMIKSNASLIPYVSSAVSNSFASIDREHRPKNHSQSLPDLSFYFFPSPSPLTTAHKPLKFPNLSFPLNPLRLIKFHFMSLPPPNLRHNLNLRHFATPQSLSDWLKPRLPSESFASWGVKPGTKNIHNLWLELSEGETSLADSTPPVRTVQVLSVRIIGKDNRLLLESHQELSDGTTRHRNRPLSEKMKPNETPESALCRAVKEELGSVLIGPIADVNCSQTVRIVQGSYRTKVEERNSVSYPGLPACYILHSIDAWVEGLPDIDFCTEEVEYTDCEATVVADKAVSVKRHHWKWVSADSVQS